MSKKVNNIIDELDPNQKKCSKCGKYKHIEEFITTIVNHPIRNRICGDCQVKQAALIMSKDSFQG